MVAKFMNNYNIDIENESVWGMCNCVIGNCQSRILHLFNRTVLTTQQLSSSTFLVRFNGVFFAEGAGC